MLFSPFYQRKKLFERHKKALSSSGQIKGFNFCLKKKQKQNRMMEQLYGQIFADVIVYILGGVWVISEKKIFCRLISRGKHYCKEIAGEKKLLQWKKYKAGKKILYAREKKFYHQRFWSKRIVTHPNHPCIPPCPPQVKWSAPKPWKTSPYMYTN